MNGDNGGKQALHVLGLCGSLRTAGYTRRALQVALEGAAEVGAHIGLIDLGQYDLPFCGAADAEAARYPDVVALQQRVRRAHGLLIATPEYHGSYSGVLKNALDLMGFEEFEGKLVGLVGVSGGALGAIEALSALRTVGRALHAWVVPQQAAIAQVSRAFAEDGMVGPEVAERLRAVGRQVAQFADLHRCGQMRDFINLWEQAPLNPGGTQATIAP